MTGKFRAKGRPRSVDFGLVAEEEISNHRGDAGDMNMQLVLAAACGRIYSHSDLVSQQLTARPSPSLSLKRLSTSSLGRRKTCLTE